MRVHAACGGHGVLLEPQRLMRLHEALCPQGHHWLGGVGEQLARQRSRWTGLKAAAQVDIPAR